MVPKAMHGTNDWTSHVKSLQSALLGTDSLGPRACCPALWLPDVAGHSALQHSLSHTGTVRRTRNCVCPVSDSSALCSRVSVLQWIRTVRGPVTSDLGFPSGSSKVTSSGLGGFLLPSSSGTCSCADMLPCSHLWHLSSALVQHVWHRLAHDYVRTRGIWLRERSCQAITRWVDHTESRHCCGQQSPFCVVEQSGLLLVGNKAGLWGPAVRPVCRPSKYRYRRGIAYIRKPLDAISARLVRMVAIIGKRFCLYLAQININYMILSGKITFKLIWSNIHGSSTLLVSMSARFFI